MKREPVVTHETMRGRPVVRVELSKSKTALLDPEDWQRIADEYGKRWAAVSNGSGLWSARKATRRADGRVVMMTLARAVMRATDGQRVETVNGDALDCRRVNLDLVRNANEKRQREANKRWREKLDPNTDKENVTE
ncbi:hypothetical protein V5738_13400 [Salinisphaera sp. SPP-AMP-43]|uniref:hypothetical protein n=1 Tax=Salinisphaera sp. SPP-AMP-43 TaxID=3121288 RepID=UPI003C6E7179